MDVVRNENIKVPNAVLVSGLTGEPTDDEVFQYLEQYGKIERIIELHSTAAKFRDSSIVEFSSGESLELLKDILPCKRPTCKLEVTHHIQLLSDLYTADQGSSLTQTYLAELQNVAKLSGTNFEKVLLDELARIQKSTQTQLTELDTSKLNEEVLPTNDHDPALNVSVRACSFKHDTPSPESGTHAFPSPQNKPLYIPPDYLTPPEVQKVVVEHVIRNADVSPQYYGNTRIRPFSGKTPCPTAESDYETWRSNVEFQLGDPTVSDKHTTRKIIESLLPPAANFVKHLGPSSTPHEYLALLDSAYGIVEDGDELFAKFLTTNQDSGEKPSIYVQRLQATLNKVVKRGGLAASETDSQLLKQFCRGCWDNALITSLQLEQKKTKPPSFSELLLLLRTEEDRQAAKSNRMRQHLGLNKAKAQLNSLTSNEYVPDISAVASSNEAFPSHTQKLEKQMEALQAQIASLKASLTSKQGQSKKKPKFQTKPSTEDNPPSSAESNHKRKPRPWYCFNCGENGHIKPSCTGEPNRELVEQKNKELKQKQAAWENLN